MRNIDQHTITAAFLARLDPCPNPRLKQVLGALVTHLHDFAREVKLTEAEWMQGIQFLTATGQMCSAERQEFILLSDTLGLSMLTVALNQAKPPGATEATVFGPFHVDDAPHLPAGSDIAAGAPGEPLFVEIRVSTERGEPVPDAEVDVWQADEAGLYDVQYAGLAQRRARAVMRTDAQGRLHFRAIVPTPYPVPTDGPVGQMLSATGRHPWRPAHLHFLIRAEGCQTLITHLFRDGDAYLDSDVVFGVRSTLIVPVQRHEAGVAPDGTPMDGPFHTLRYHFVLASAAA
jgi:hydroxyquinol 1,2-dioxygenase